VNDGGEIILPESVSFRFLTKYRITKFEDREGLESRRDFSFLKEKKGYPEKRSNPFEFRYL